jgi:hypothetical protein
MGIVTRDALGSQAFPSLEGSCTLCGESSRAYWQGDNGLIEVCHSCALSTLPALIADATYLTHTHACDDAKLALVDIERTYWRAMFQRALREARR